MNTETQTTTEPKGYNGWSSYETWAVKLWMDNDESAYNYWQERIEQAIEEFKEKRDDATNYPQLFNGYIKELSFTENLIPYIAEVLKAEHEEQLPTVEGFAADLLNAAFGEVDFHEIAESLLQTYTENNPDWQSDGEEIDQDAE